MPIFNFFENLRNKNSFRTKLMHKQFNQSVLFLFLTETSKNICECMYFFKRQNSKYLYKIFTLKCINKFKFLQPKLKKKRENI